MNKTKRNDLTKGAVNSTLTRLTIPMIFGMLGLVIFNMVDTFYIGKLGTSSLAAITFTFPVVLIINSITHGIGVATSSLISKAIGEKNHHKVLRYTTDSLLLGIVLVLLSSIIGLLTIDPLFKTLGATEEILPIIREYMTIWYLGTAFIVIPMIGNSAIRALGDTKTPSIVMTVAALANVILDPVLIFGFAFIPALGVKGAALATVLARAITLLFSLYVLIYKEKIVSFKSITLIELKNSWKDILYIGIPNALTKVTTPLAAALITGLVATYGKESVAAFGIVSRIEMFALLVIGALSSVISPFIGQNLGAKKIDRVKHAIKSSEIFSMGYGIIMAILLAMFGSNISFLFTPSVQVANIVQSYLWIVPLSYGFQGALMIDSNAFNVLNKPMTATYLLLIRMFVIYIPLSFITSKFMGLQGVWISMLVSFAVVSVVTHYMLKSEFKTNKKQVYSLN